MNLLYNIRLSDDRDYDFINNSLRRFFTFFSAVIFAHSRPE